MKKIFAFALLIITFSTAVFQAQTRTSENNKSDKKSASSARASLDSFRTKFIEAYNSQNADRVAEFYAEDATYIGTGGDVVQGRRNIHLGLKGEVAYFKNFVVTPGEFGSDKNLAYERGAYSATLAIPNQPEQTVNGKYLLIFRRQKDKTWKIQMQMVSRDRNTQR